MLPPDEDNQEFLNDPRPACKYGNLCYQKNSQHTEKFKHPPKKTTKQFSEEEYKMVYGKRKRGKVNQIAECSTSKDKKEAVLEGNARKPLNYMSDSNSNSPEPDLALDCKIEVKAKESNNVAPKASTKIPSQFINMELVEKTIIPEVTVKNKNDAVESVVLVSEPIRPLIESRLESEKFILEKFLVKMPPDFISFWNYCLILKPGDPCEAFAHVGLHLVGPFDVLAGKFAREPERSPEEYLVHWRYFYDPPEFQTIVRGPNPTGYHIGYFRDDPNEPPVFVGSNEANVNGEIKIMGDNIFAAVSKYLETALKSCDPFKKMTFNKALTQIKTKAAMLNLNLSDNTDSIKARSKKILSSTFNKAGLVVPYNRKTQLGYRHLYISNKDLRKLLDRVAASSEQQRSKVLSDLQPVLTAASIATDECDFGTGLELGWNILAHGVDSLNSTIEQYLSTAYNLINRDAFSKIAAAHMANRKKGTNLSIL